MNALGFCAPQPATTGRGNARAAGGAQTWQQWVDRWYATSTLTPRARVDVRSRLLEVGRWSAAEHPEAADPTAWTLQTCATWVAALDRMNVGDYVHRTTGLEKRLGTPLTASTKDCHLAAIRRSFADWVPGHSLRACANLQRGFRALRSPRREHSEIKAFGELL